MEAQELEAIANRLISDADVNKQVLTAIPPELIACVCPSFSLRRSHAWC